MIRVILTFALVLQILLPGTNIYGKSKAMRVQLPAVEITFDPHAMEDAYSMFLSLQMHRGLFRYTPQGDILPDLVERWTLSKDKKIYTFKLKGATFSDGSPILSDDVVKSFARIFARGASIGADLESILGAKKFRSNKQISELGIRAIDKRTVEVKLSRPSAIFLKQLAAVDCAILKISDFREEYPITTQKAVSGPYKAVKADRSNVVLHKWRSDKLDSSSPPQTIEVYFGNEDPFILAMTGKVDILDVDYLTDEKIDELIRSSWHRVPTELVMERFLVINPNVVPYEVRKLMFGLVDHKKLITMLGDQRFAAAYGLIPYGMPGSLNAEDISDISFKDPKIKIPLTKVKVAYNIESKNNEKIASWLKQEWEKSGVLQIDLIPEKGTELLASMFKKQGDVLFGWKGIDYFDGYSILTYFRSTYESNYFFVKSAEVDKLLDEAVSIEDKLQRAQFYKKIQREILSNYTVIPLTFGSLAAGLWGPRAVHVPPHPGGLHTLPMETVKIKT